MRQVSLLICLLALSGCSGFGPLADHLPPEPEATGEPKTSGVRLTYLGTNGYLVETDAKRILIDPYFSRIGFATAALNLPTAPRTDRIDRYLAQLKIDRESLDLILITHGHFDHLMDVPHIVKKTGAPVLASETSCHLLRALGVPGRLTVPTRPGKKHEQGALQVRTLTASHDTICCGAVPFPGRLNKQPDPPRTPSHYVLGEPLAFTIRLAGKNIYIDSGGTPAVPPPADLAPVDLAILGVALPDSRARLAEALSRLQPEVFL
ncbi:MAG: MBL fold metallo-hydrolase, partial [Phycisphaeraceae bacterium]|nr:MBL fold metallo-hydrolase [Phycisphaeraceae bacterium]